MTYIESIKITAKINSYIPFGFKWLFSWLLFPFGVFYLKRYGLDNWLLGINRVKSFKSAGIKDGEAARMAQEYMITEYNKSKKK